jgi:glycosyltransferase involved in cell wall biosynthesis
MYPTVSVIIPIYDVENFLPQCLDSLLAQSFEDFEGIGVDDRSTDNSASIFEGYTREDRRFRLVRHSQNKGLPSARNSGIAAASGTYLFFLDSDDWISPHALEILFDLACNDAADIAMGGTLKCEDEGGFARPENHASYMQEDLHGVTVFNVPLINYSVVSWNKLIRADFIRKNNLIFSPEPKRFEDMLTYKWYLSGAKVSLTTDITYFYRQRSSIGPTNSIMQEKGPSILRDKLLALADICTFLIERGFFKSRYDPLHYNSHTNLPRTLSWIIPVLLQGFQKADANSKLSFEQAFRALEMLCHILPEDYISGLPYASRSACHIMRSFELYKDITKLYELYNI